MYQTNNYMANSVKKYSVEPVILFGLGMIAGYALPKIFSGGGGGHGHADHAKAHHAGKDITDSF